MRRNLYKQRFYDRVSNCRTTGKVRYKSAEAAVTALAQAVRRRAVADRANFQTARQETRMYECKFCKGWHLSSKQKLVFATT